MRPAPRATRKILPAPRRPGLRLCLCLCPVPANSLVARPSGPRELAAGTIGDIYRSYDIGPVLPAMGYRPEQLHELERMINAADAVVVVIATPVDLARLVTIGKPTVRVRYDAGGGRGLADGARGADAGPGGTVVIKRLGDGPVRPDGG
jgi:hypothetical protein